MLAAMSGPDVSAIASLLADRSRAAMLDALMGGEERAARSLALAAGVRPPTASSHLQKLLDAGLVTAVRKGRERRFRLAGSEVAEAIEALGVLARPARVRGLRDANRREALRRARTCYDHLAGQFGVELAAGLVRDGCLRGTELRLTRRGEERMLELGIDIGVLRRLRRPLTLACLDGTERKLHLAGALGSALAACLFEQGWVERISNTRAVRVTERGSAELRALDWITSSRDEAGRRAAV
jgi:DNA-binding transcriptional ArsR family regulator